MARRIALLALAVVLMAAAVSAQEPAAEELPLENAGATPTMTRAGGAVGTRTLYYAGTWYYSTTSTTAFDTGANIAKTVTSSCPSLYKVRACACRSSNSGVVTQESRPSSITSSPSGCSCTFRNVAGAAVSSTIGVALNCA